MYHFEITDETIEAEVPSHVSTSATIGAAGISITLSVICVGVLSHPFISCVTVYCPASVVENKDCVLTISELAFFHVICAPA